jgi:hypothetical protein
MGQQQLRYCIRPVQPITYRVGEHGEVAELARGDVRDGARYQRPQLGARQTPVVALQVAFERQTLKPVFSLDRL